MKIKQKKISYLILFTFLGIVLVSSSVILFRKMNTELNSKIIQQQTQKIAIEIEKNLFEKLEGGTRSLSVLPEIIDVVNSTSIKNNKQVLISLQTAKNIFNAAIVYVMDTNGTVVASTSYGNGKSLLGNNYRFRPYFINAMKGNDSIFSAIGVTTGERGIYFSSPIFDKDNAYPIGVVVIKTGFEKADSIMKYVPSPIMLLSPEGIVFSSNKKELLYKHAYPLSEKTTELLKEHKTLANKKLLPLENFLTQDYVKMKGTSYIVSRYRIPRSSWEVVYLNKPDNRFSNETTFKILFIFILVISLGLLSIIYFLVVNIIDKKNYQTKLEQSQNNYKTLYELAPDGICITTMDGRFLSCNETFLNIFKYTMTELSNMNIKNLYISPEKDRPILLSELKRKKILKNYNIKFVDAYGVQLNTSNSFAIIEYNGQPCIESFVRDISDLDKREEQLKQAQKMQMIGSLAGELATNFNNVLGGVTGTTSILKYKINNNEKLTNKELEKYINTIEFSGKRAKDLVSQLLSLSQKKNPNNKAIELNKLLSNIADSCKENYDHIDVILNKYKNEAFILAESTLIEQIFHHIALNAYHAMTIMRKKKGKIGGKLIIDIDNIFADDSFCMSHPEADYQEYWTISFSDTGVGMDFRTVAKIFEPFFTLKEKSKGMGLGLSMAYNIAKQYSGFIDVYSEPDLGSKFTIYLPAHYPKGKSREAKENKNHIYKGEGTILVIDDEKVMRDLSEEILRECGYKVYSAENGTNGIEIYEKKQKTIDMVIIDMVMPDYTGKEVYIKLKEINPDVRVIITSGFRQDSRANEIIDMGAISFIQKPYTIEKLSKIIKDNI